MKIVLASSPARFNFPLRVIGNAGRYDTVSDVEFLDASHLVCNDRQMARLYLIQFDLDAGTHRILDNQEFIVDGMPQNFELLHLREKRVYSIVYKDTLFYCDINANRFINPRTVKVAAGEGYHGICGAGADSVFLTNMYKNSITEYNFSTGARLSIPCIGGTRMKDAAVIDDTYLLALSCESGPKNGMRAADGSVTPTINPFDSHLLIYERASGALIRKLVIEKAQIDGCIFTERHCFVTCTNMDGSGYLLRARIDAEYNFMDVTRIPCASFPHGVARLGNMLAYTSYGDSAVFIHKLEDGVDGAIDLEFGPAY